MSDGELLRDREKGIQAQSLLNDEMIKDAFASLRQTYSEKLFSTTIDQTGVRERLYMATRVVNEVERQLQSIADNGKLAEAELNRMFNEAEAKKKDF